MIKFGQGNLVLKHGESIILMKYSDEDIVYAKEIYHRVLDIPGECELIHMVLPLCSQYIILFYLLNGAMTIIIWDIEKNIEHSSFFGRKEDKFLDYVTGRDSKLGYACFDKYLVNLDN